MPLSACTKSYKDYDNNEEFAKAKLPAHTETGAGTLGCQLGAQAWNVLGKSYQNGGLGSPWHPNALAVEGRYSVPPSIGASGRMTGGRDSKTFYDMQISLVSRPSDTLGGLHLLGADTARTYTGRFVAQMSATNFMALDDYTSRSQRPVRLLVRKLDRQQRIVSGTFEGWLYGGASGHISLAVTDGRLAFKYSPTPAAGALHKHALPGCP